MTKPAEDPKVHEPEQQVPAYETSVLQTKELVHDVPPEIPDLSSDRTDINPLNSESSSLIKLSEIHDDVIITGTGFKEPGNPTVLAKHSAKQEFI